MYLDMIYCITTSIQAANYHEVGHSICFLIHVLDLYGLSLVLLLMNELLLLFPTWVCIRLLYTVTTNIFHESDEFPLGFLLGCFHGFYLILHPKTFECSK